MRFSFLSNTSFVAAFSLLSRGLFFAVTGFVALAISANNLEAVTPVPFTEPVSFSFRATGSAWGEMSTFDEYGGRIAILLAGSQPAESTHNTAFFRPGKEYEVKFWAKGFVDEYWLSYIAPKGYYLLIDKVASSMTHRNPSDTGGYTHYFTIELRPIARSGPLTLGKFSGIDIGKSITWEIGLGTKRNGQSAGRVIFKETDLSSSNDPANVDKLYYAPPLNYGEAWTEPDPNDADVIRQVHRANTFLDIIDHSSGNGYTVKVYRNQDIQGNPNGLDSPLANRNPWKTIRVESPATNQLKITETEGSTNQVSELKLLSGSITSGAYVWQLQEGNVSTWARTVTHTSSTVSGGRQVVIEVRSGGATGTIVSKTKHIYTTLAWGEEVTQVIQNPDTAQAPTTTYAYHEDSSLRGNYRRIKSTTHPTGNWQAHWYYNDWDKRGQSQYQYQPYLDLPASAPTLLSQSAADSAAASGRSVKSTYVADWTTRHARPDVREVRDENKLTGKSTWTHGDIVIANEWSREHATIHSYSDASSYQVSYVERMRADAGYDDPGKPVVTHGPDKRKTTFSWVYGTFNPSTDVFTVNSGVAHERRLSVHGTTETSGTTSVSSFDGQDFPAVQMVEDRSTLDAEIRDAQGHTIRTETYVYTSSGFSTVPVSWQEHVYDDYNRRTKTISSNGTEKEFNYIGGRLDKSIDIDDSETTYSYDGLGRATTITKKGVGSQTAELTSGYNYLSQSDVVTTNTYDGSNRVTQQVVASNGLSLTTTNVFDKSGRLTETTVPGGFKTVMAYTNGGRTVTTTLPGGATQIADSHLDGRPDSLSGTGVVAADHSYSVANDGKHTHQTYAGGVAANTTTAVSDWFGRTIESSSSGWNGVGTLVSKMHYNSLGQLTKTEAPGVAPTLYEYDELGYMWRSGLDENDDGLDDASMDRITETESYFVLSGGAWHSVLDTYSYLEDGVGGTPEQISKSLTKLTNLGVGRISETRFQDIFDNESVTYTEVDTGTHTLITTTQTALTTDFDMKNVVYNGRAVESQDSTGIIVRTEHDALGRPTKVIHPRTGTAETAYQIGSSLIDWTKDTTGTKQATYLYNSAGRTASVKDPYGNFIRYDYNDRGQTTHTWGEAAYPIENVYDDLGRRTHLKTYRAGSGWSGNSWPTSTTGTADTTTWAYDDSTGLLNFKKDAANRSVSYSYTAAGQLDVRTWARGVTTDYGYDAKTGELTSANYSDDTPDITNVYNRRGLLASVKDVTTPGGSTDLRIFDYCDCGKLIGEQLGSHHSSRHLSYQLDMSPAAANHGVKGRTIGYTLKTSSTGTTLHQLSYGFDINGRLDEITTAGDLGAHTFDYDYLTDSNLVTTLDVRSGSSADPFRYERTWEGNRNLVASTTTKWGTGTSKFAKYEYTYDAKNRRSTAIQSGTAFADYLVDTHRRYTYNARSELTSDISYANAVIANTPTNDMSSRRFEFGYDNLGNRTSSNRTGVPALADTYTTNTLNQYTARENNTIAVAGTVANSTIDVVVTPKNGGASQPAGRAEGFWGAEVTPNNANGPVEQTIDVHAVIPGQGGLIAKETKTTQVASADQTKLYDLDGNVTSDGFWSYHWDGENRLIKMYTAGFPGISGGESADPVLSHSGATAGTDEKKAYDQAIAAWSSSITKQKLEFAYDYLHRRVQKKTYTWNGSAWTLATHRKFLYEGWNVIREDEELTNKAKTLAWGLDVVSSLSGSAGVGALVMLHDSATTKTYLPGYDGNGNVAVMIDAANGDLKATYEYGPYGQYLRKEGDYADANPIRFSTKYTDEETNLVYYGRRYYDPKDGRFVCRDPLEESGGINLMAFVANNAPNRWDYLGMYWDTEGHMSDFNDLVEAQAEMEWLSDREEDGDYGDRPGASFFLTGPSIHARSALAQHDNMVSNTFASSYAGSSGSQNDDQIEPIITPAGTVTSVGVVLTPHGKTIEDIEEEQNAAQLFGDGLDLVLEVAVKRGAGLLVSGTAKKVADEIAGEAFTFGNLFKSLGNVPNVTGAAWRGVDIHATVEFEKPGSTFLGIPIPWGTSSTTTHRRVDNPAPGFDGGWPEVSSSQVERNIDRWFPEFVDTAVDIILDTDTTDD